MMKKVLCATDGSHASEKAVDWVIEMVKGLRELGGDVQLTFLTVSLLSEEDAAKTHYWDEVIIEASNEQLYRELHGAKVKALQAGVKDVTLVRASGRNIAATVIDYAEKEGYDHLVVGSTGRTGVSRLLLGSVACDIATKAHCPVTIVR
ncbi:MAG: universal stress protein [Deferrisomatales bacterium]